MSSPFVCYSVDWKLAPGEFRNERRRPDDREPGRAVRVTCLDEADGRLRHVVKRHPDWIGVCTDDFGAVLREIHRYLPGVRTRHDRLDPRKPHRRVLPYFADRLGDAAAGRRDPFDSASPFYRVYPENCPAEEVGEFLGRRFDVDYYRDSDWLVRLYVDVCAKCGGGGGGDGHGFFYRWYRVDDSRSALLDAFDPLPPGEGLRLLPRFRLAAFDIETVAGPSPANDDRVPDGTDPEDRIVAISVVRWNSDDGAEETAAAADEMVLYLNPLASTPLCRGGGGVPPKLRLGDRRYLEYSEETDLLNDFHFFVRDCHVLTGYNVDLFDLPCIYARLLFLDRRDLLRRYGSRRTGDRAVATFDEKPVIDLYAYFRTFSNYDLVGFKLDQVARARLGRGKVPVDASGLRAWYNDLAAVAVAATTRESEGGPPEDDASAAVRFATEACRSRDAPACRESLVGRGRGRRRRAAPAEDRFGTFATYLEYCLRDSQVVRDLFRKETVLCFLIERTRHAAIDVVQALHYGSSRYLEGVVRACGTAALGYFVNAESFRNQSDGSEYDAAAGSGGARKKSSRYQGALNFCLPESHFRDVATLDFASMYPTTLLSSNLSYDTCDVMTAGELARLDESVASRLEVVPYRIHRSPSDDFRPPVVGRDETYRVGSGDDCGFRYPVPDPKRDALFVVHLRSPPREETGFLPALVRHFLELRERRKREWKRTGDVAHRNAQLCVKLLLNSLYGVMASRDSPLAYMPVAMSVVALARYQLLGAFHFVRDVLGYAICYADTDSLMVHRWPHDHCDPLNAFMRRSLPHVRVEFEERMSQLLVLSKKRYLYRRAAVEPSPVETKGFQKKANDVVRFMRDVFKRKVMDLDGERGDPSEGWCLWVDTLLAALHMCRDPRRHAVTRKTRKLSEYRSQTCPAVKILRKRPEREGQYVDYVFGRADVSKEEEGNCIMEAEDCRYANFEKLFVSQKKTFCTLLNLAYWRDPDHARACDAVLNAIRWAYFVRAEILHRAATGRKLTLLTERGVTYAFRINDHLSPKKKRKSTNDDGDSFDDKRKKCVK